MTGKHSSPSPEFLNLYRHVNNTDLGVIRVFGGLNASFFNLTLDNAILYCVNLYEINVYF